MASYLVGTRLLVTVTITDKATGVVVDPATLAFRLHAPADSAVVAGTYAWNGTAWTNSEAVIAVPTKGATGIFTLRITVPYVNTAAGTWCLAWKTTANGGGYGEGSGVLSFVALESCGLDA